MDLVDPVAFSRKLRENLEEKNAILERLGEEPLNYNEIHRTYHQDFAEILKKYMADTSLVLSRLLPVRSCCLKEPRVRCLMSIMVPILCYLLFHLCWWCATGTGVSPREIHEAVGISKAYVTRVGSGSVSYGAVGGDRRKTASGWW